MNTSQDRSRAVWLVGSVVVSCIAALFVQLYASISESLHNVDHAGQKLPYLTEIVTYSSWLGYLVPVVAAVLGIYLLKIKRFMTLIDIIIVTAWVLSVTWICIAIIAWQLPKVPIVGPLNAR